MKIFVTVGTTPFERLVKRIGLLDNPEDEFIIQTAKPDSKVINHKNFCWTKNIDTLYHWADLIICHAGAGTIYKLLELGKPIIVVPNLDRTDSHQNEIANFVRKNNYGFVCEDLRTLDLLITKVKTKADLFKKYDKEDFFLRNFIIDFIRRVLD